MNIIEFPGLWGLKFSINPIALHFGSISIYWYGIIIATAFMLAVLLAMRASRKFGLEEENIVDMVLIAAPISVICARIYYVIFTWDKYKDDISEVFKIWHGGIALYGSLIGALLAAYFFARAKKIKPFHLFDFAIPYFVLAQSIGRWGNFVNQEAFGVNTTLPWGMTSDRIQSQLSLLQAQGVNVSPDLPVHPTFLYESLWNLAVFFLLIWYRKKKKSDGEVLSLYMIAYGLGRFWIEGLRTDSLMLGSLRISQVLAFAFVVGFGIIFYILRKRGAKVIDEAETVPSEYAAVLQRINGETTEGENVAEVETDDAVEQEEADS